MKRSFFCLLTLFFFSAPYFARAQYESFHHEGEFGFQIGAAHYFGDLNPDKKLNRPKIAGGVFFRKQLNDYVAFRLGANFIQLGYSDIYEKKNEFQIRRNLSFNSNIFELMLQGDFNFFRFNPSNPNERFTPYLTFGAGVFNFDPYAYLGGTKYFLRPLGTEGQGSAFYPDRKPYSSVAFAFPVGIGVKYALNEKVNLNFEIAHRFTTTDYLDDVSTTYAGLTAFPAGSAASYLQDRSYEIGPRIGTTGNQRGFSGQKDQYILVTVGVTFNITSYRCPSAN
jgi:opacity protein-like surface antigen